MRKIDERLFHQVTALNASEIECVVYLTDLKYISLIRDNMKVVKVFDFIKAIGVKTTLTALEKVAQADFVKYATINSSVCAFINKAKAIMNINNFYQDNCLGQGINVAVIDTGISPLPDFCIPQNRIIKFVDFVNGRKDPYDDNGHGTFISGVLLGNGLISNGK